MDNCVFCKIINGDLPCYKIYENEYVLAFLDISKDLEGHTLVIPKRHYKNILDCEEKYLTECIKAVQLISKHYFSKGYNGVNILNANEQPAEQSVFHLHFHILPRKNNDGLRTFPKLDQQDLDMQKICENLAIK